MRTRCPDGSIPTSRRSNGCASAPSAAPGNGWARSGRSLKSRRSPPAPCCPVASTSRCCSRAIPVASCAACRMSAPIAATSSCTRRAVRSRSAAATIRAASSSTDASPSCPSSPGCAAFRRLPTTCRGCPSANGAATASPPSIRSPHSRRSWARSGPIPRRIRSRACATIPRATGPSRCALIGRCTSRTTSRASTSPSSMRG